MKDVEQKTINDFSDQWSRYPENEGYYGSAELFMDIVGPLLRREDITGAHIAEIGSGTGRITRMLLSLGAAHVVSLEPASGAFKSLKANTRDLAERITYVHARGEDLPDDPRVDLVVSVGVIHHIPDPDPTVRAAFHALKPGGRCLFWLYGAEGNRTYLTLAKPLRVVSRRLPHSFLSALCSGLNALLDVYIAACRRAPAALPLPLRTYVLNVLAPLTRSQRNLVIYDQLNPTYAKYYTREEALDLLRRAGFIDCRVHHRHGYSWTASGSRPGIVTGHARTDR